MEKEGIQEKRRKTKEFDVRVPTRNGATFRATLKNYSMKTAEKDSYSIIEICPHDIAEIQVISTCVTCEVTQLVCIECGEKLEEPKTEC